MAGWSRSRAARFLVLLTREIRNVSVSEVRSTESLVFCKSLDQGFPRILQRNSTTTSNSALKNGCLGKELGSLNLPALANYYRSHSVVASRISGNVRDFATGSSQNGKRILTHWETKCGQRCYHELGLQRVKTRSQSLFSSCSSRTKLEFNIQGRRTYYVDKQGIQHFKRRGPSSWSEKFASQKSMGVLLVLGGVGVFLYFSNQQTIPYTHRKHLMLMSPKLERSIGDHTFDAIMKQYKGRVLPPNHPESVRVHKIANQVIEALLLEVKASDWGQLEKGGEALVDYTKEWEKDPHERKSDRSLLEPYSVHTHKEDDLLDDTWVQKSRHKGLQSGQEGYTKHLEGMKWKVVVVDDDIVNAICIPGGKIVVFTGLLKKFHADAEVATVLAHEIGHAVARHSAESLTKNFFIVIVQLIILSIFYLPGLVNSISELLLRLPFSRRMEIEADHIGLLLMAAAGYDPRVAPGLYEKLGKLDNVPEYAQYMSTHPSGKKRGELLRHTATMDEALRVYQQKMSGLGTEGFF